MRRPELTRSAIFLAIGSCLLLWLVYATRPEAQIHALEAQPAKSAPVPLDLATNQPATENAAEENDNVSSLTPLTEIVPTGNHSALRHVPIENVTGPEPLPGLTPAAVLENMRGVIRDYGARFGGNPFGNNREITAKLNGGNPKQIVFLKEEDGMRINERGELIDNWGTPFFFHQISGTEMEIHSAGPDRKMWTADDLVLK